MRIGFSELGIIIKFTDFYKFVPLAFGRIFSHNGVIACFNFNIIGAFSAPQNKHKRKHRNFAKRAKKTFFIIFLPVYYIGMRQISDTKESPPESINDYLVKYTILKEKSNRKDRKKRS